ncbi:MAG: hypothetical protein JO152_14560 [Mycobacteriaceae bacterium]|nr:hypothetical protein [Mycobacteriaceae bacterium]
MKAEPDNSALDVLRRRATAIDEPAIGQPAMKTETTMEKKTLLQRAADRQMARRERHGGLRWTRRIVAMVSVLSLTMVAGIAYAAWTTTATGNATSKADTLSISINAAAAYSGAADLLHPGLQANGTTTGGDLQLSVTNNNSYTLFVDTIQQNGLITTSNTGTCANDTGTFPGTVTSASQVYVGTGAAYPTTTGGFTVTPTAGSISIPSGTSVITIAHVVSMTSTSANGCQGVSFTVPVLLTAGSS